MGGFPSRGITGRDADGDSDLPDSRNTDGAAALSVCGRIARNHPVRPFDAAERYSPILWLLHAAGFNNTGGNDGFAGTR